MTTDTHPYPAGSTEAILLSLPRPIAVVGNGHPARAFGALIDRYPSVLRFNNYVIRGFEDRVGTRTTLRVTSGWSDVEVRHGVPEISPWHAQRHESSGLSAYRQRGGQEPATAAGDVTQHLAGINKPSTGLALLALCDQLGIEVDAFGFDSFAGGHYWQEDRRPPTTVHGRDELARVRAMHCVTLMGETGDVRLAPHTVDAVRTVQDLGLRLQGERMLVFTQGDGRLAQLLQQQGNQVTAMDSSVHALEPLQVDARLQGQPLDLTLLALRESTPFDRFVSFGALDRLGDNDVRLALRGAASACRGLLVSVSTQPTADGSLETARPVAWWMETISRHFVVNAIVPGTEIGQMLFEGHARHLATDHTGMQPTLARPPHEPGLDLPPGYRARPRPEYYVDSVENNRRLVWQPDVYPTAAKLAKSLGCRTIVDIGCGQARKLQALPPEFELIGVDFGPNIDYCRTHHQRGVWIEADLESALPLPIPRRVLADAVIVCSDVIEHMVDPMALLALLKHMLRDAAAVVLSTPDRVRTNGPADNGPSPNASHTREWTLDELGRLLRRAGFEIALQTHTRSNNAEPQMATSLVIMVNAQHAAVAEAKATPADASAAPGTAPSMEPATALAPAPRPSPVVTPPPHMVAPAANRVSVMTPPATPPHAGSETTESADALLERAQERLTAGDVASFESMLASLLQRQPDHAGARRLLAGMQLSMGDPAEAAWIYDDLIAKGHRDSEVLEGAVLAHWRSGDVRAAAQRMLTHA